MNYLTGLALGISAGQQLNQLLRGRGFRLIHALPGRRRYRHDDLLHNPQLACRWQRQLSAIPGMRKVEMSPTTGSALVVYTCPDEHVDAAMTYVDQLHTVPEANAHYGKLGGTIRRGFYHLNQNIFETSNRALDLRTITALLFIVKGVVKICLAGHRPTGPQLLWWAYSLLKGRK
jgi:hypothetical protein